ncbi:tyrosine-type recombinase/integrase [Rhizobium leguminosarum]
MAIPEACRSYFNGTTMYLQSLRTGDIKAAMPRRDKLETEVRELFSRVRAGEVIGSGETIAELRGKLSRAAITEALTEGGEALEDAVWAAEAEADSLRGKARERFTRAIAGDHPADHYLEAYLSAIKLAAKTTNERRGLINRFTRWCVGEKYRLPDITRRAAGRYVTEVIEPMDRSTAKKHMTALRGYWEYLIKRGHVAGSAEDNPWLGQEVANGRRRVERGDNESERPFTEAELKTLLYAPYPKGMSEGFKQQIADALRISCLSGMRLAEVLTLWVEEVHNGIFDIQQGKTRSAARKVPIHPDLSEIIARRLKGKQPKDWLFHELAEERDPGDTFGKRFNNYREKLGVDDKRPGKRRSLVNFHSARRWFITQARHAGQTVETVKDVVGHVSDKKKDITFGVYTQGASEKQMEDCVGAVRLPSRG